MKISNEAKRWIEDNATWLDELNFDEGRDIEKVFKKIPSSLFTEIYQIFKTAGIELLDNNSGNMYGIKSSDGYTTLSLGKHNKTNFNINFTISEGMKGGHQIGFKSISDALDFIENINNTLGVAQDLRPSKMQPKVVSQYNWIEVDTVYGKCMVTNVAFDRYDPTSAAKNRLKNRADKEILAAETDWIQSNIDADIIKRYILDNFGESNDKYYSLKVELDGEYNIPTQRPTFSGVINLHNVQCLDSDVNKIVSDLSHLCNMKVNLVDTYNYQNKSMMTIWIRPDTPEFNEIEPNIYAKYGI